MITAPLSTELTKLKGTSTLWVSVLFPVFILIVAFITLLIEFSEATARSPRIVAGDWNMALRGWWTFWAAVAVPVLIAVEAVGLAGPEHAGKHWKQLYSLPIPRWSIFAAKSIVCWLLTALSFLLFSTGMVGLSLLRSGMFHLNLSSAIPWGLLIKIACEAYLACGATIAVQTWLSMQFSGFVIPVGTALAATMAGALFEKIHVANCWPWTMPVSALPFVSGQGTTSALIGPFAFVALAVLARWRLSHTQVV